MEEINEALDASEKEGGHKAPCELWGALAVLALVCAISTAVLAAEAAACDEEDECGGCR
jgi:hypothetical protein